MSEIITDTITGKSTATTITIGSTPVVSSSANSMTIRGEGTAQTSIQQGLAKAWFHFNGTGTATINDSFNGASLTDSATGQFICNLTSAMSSTEYATVSASNDNAVDNKSADTNQPNSASAYKHNHFENNVDTDIAGNSNAVLGDLA
jgi:hypothetical protein